MDRTRSIVKYIICGIILLFGALVFISTQPSNIAAQAATPVEVEILQSEEVFYTGTNYLNNNKFANFASGGEFQNALYSALTIKVDGQTDIGGEKIVIPHQDFTIVSENPIILPKSYNCIVTVLYDAISYEKNVTIVVSKAELIVRVKINGVTNLEIDEGEQYLTNVEYEGFVLNDNINTLEIPAIIVMEPKRPILNYAMVASGAKSSLYEFVYEEAILTIKSNPLTELKVKEGEANILVIKGHYSPYSELEFVNVGISPANAHYIKIKANLDKYYASSSIYDDYKETEAYSINLQIDGIKEENVNSEIKIKLPQKSIKKEKYLVVAFYNNGLYEVITGTEKDGILTFNAADLGDFVVFTPVEGIKTTVLIAICIGLIGGFILIIILVSIFRRKY